MNEEQILIKLQSIRSDLIRELAYINGKHDALANELAMVNNLITDIDGFEEDED